MGRQIIQDIVIIENMHDMPYLRGEVGPEIVGTMTAIAVEVKQVWLAGGCADIRRRKH